MREKNRREVSSLAMGIVVDGVGCPLSASPEGKVRELSHARGFYAA